jgi:hypothetical protein
VTEEAAVTAPAPLGRAERIVVAVVFVLGAAFLYRPMRGYFFAQHFDSVYVVQMLDGIIHHGTPVSQGSQSIGVYIADYITQPAADICKSALPAPTPASVDAFGRHAYLFLYALAPFRLIASSQVVVAAANAITFAGVPVAVYLFLRRQAVGLWFALAFCGLVLAYPGWSQAPFGQYYVDRFFVLIGLVFLLLVLERLELASLWGDRRSLVAICVLGGLGITVNERASLIVGALSAGLVVLHWRRVRQAGLLYPLIALGAVGLLWSWIYVRFVTNVPDYGSFFSSIQSFTTSMDNPTFARGVYKLLIVNAPLLLLCAAAGWRLGLLAFATLVPNIVGSVGGAEKTGWTTHYHSTYVPVLIAIGALGFVHLLRARREVAWAATGAVVVAGVALLFLDPFTINPLIRFDRGVADGNALVLAAGYDVDVGQGPLLRQIAAANQQLGGAVPKGATVTTIEAAMPALYEGRTIQFFPLAIDSADYAVLPYVGTAGGPAYTGVVSYLGQDATDQINECMRNRLAADGYNVSSPQLIGAYAVLKRG